MGAWGRGTRHIDDTFYVEMMGVREESVGEGCVAERRMAWDGLTLPYQV